MSGLDFEGRGRPDVVLVVDDGDDEEDCEIREESWDVKARVVEEEISLTGLRGGGRAP